MDPVFLGVGTFADGLGDVTPGLPPDVQVGDFLFLFVESDGADVFPPDGDGWAEVGMANNTGTRGTTLWKRVDEDTAAPTVRDTGNHTSAVILAFRHCDPIRPWDILTVASSGTAVGANQTLTFTGGTTTVDGCLVVLFAVHGVDSADASFSGWANADLEGIEERFDQGTTQGAGGGLGIMTAIKRIAGAFGDTTVVNSHTSPVWAGRHIVLRPEQPEPDSDDFPYVGDHATSLTRTSSTEHTVKLPRRRRIGDLMLMGIMTDSANTVNRPSGWHPFGGQQSGGSTGVTVMFQRVADGTESDTVPFTTTVSDETAHVVVCLRNKACAGVQAIRTGVTLSAPNPPAIDPLGWGATEKTLWITCLGSLGGHADDNDWPSGFDRYRVQSVISGVCSFHVCAKEEAVTSQDPGNWGASFGSGHYRFWTIGVRQRQHKETPSFVAAGTVDASTSGPVTPDMSAFGMDDDVAVVVVETDATASLTPPSGWAQVEGSPVTATDTRLHVWWHRMTDADSGVALTVPVVAGHRVARISVFRGPPIGGDPWNATASGVENVVDTSVAVPRGVTTVDGCLVVAVSSMGADTGADNTVQFSDWANGDLINVDEIMDNQTGQGSGGGFGVAVGELPNVGPYTETTATLATASNKAMLSFALKMESCDGADEGAQTWDHALAAV